MSYLKKLCAIVLDEANDRSFGQPKEADSHPRQSRGRKKGYTNVIKRLNLFIRLIMSQE